MITLPRLLVAAPASGQGKTTIATGLMAALARRGVEVAPAKVGPDYIDPGYHAMATGRPGRNLDPWLCGEERIVPLLAHGALTPAPADIAVIEGVMGLFDGMLDTDGFASSAHVARLTDTPVLLVLDVTGAARTVGAIAAGLARFDPQVRVAGVVLNRAGSPRHAHEASRAVEQAGLPVLGCVPRDARVGAPSRHLGLVPTAERADAEEALDRLAGHVGGHVDLDAVLELASTASDLDVRPWDPAECVTPVPWEGQRPVVAIAAGPAFTFRYTETDELLRAAGCEPVTFDPASADGLPAGTSALYLGGGFPQVHAGALMANRELLRQIRSGIAAGMPTYAECAGMLYLCELLDDHAMAGVVPAVAAMSPRLTLRYATADVAADGLVTRAGESLHGHEFHRTKTSPAAGPDGAAAWELSSSFAVPAAEGFRLDPAGSGRSSVHASYLHVHPAGHPELIQRLAEAAAGWAPAHAEAGEAPAVSAPTAAATDQQATDPVTGEVILVGGGPGDPGLLTVAGLAEIAAADVIVCDRLVPMESLRSARADAQIIHVGKIPRGPYTPQEQINAILVDNARQGRRVVRFKGGDNYVFGRGGEEWLACRDAGVPVRAIPGVSSSVAAAALAEIPVTHRNLSQGFIVVSAHVGPHDPRSDIDWASLAASRLTLVVMMGVATLPDVAGTLIGHGRATSTPAAVIADAGLASMRVVRGNLGDIAERTAAARVEPPAVVVIGEVVDALREREPRFRVRSRTIAGTSGNRQTDKGRGGQQGLRPANPQLTGAGEAGMACGPQNPQSTGAGEAGMACGPQDPQIDRAGEAGMACGPQNPQIDRAGEAGMACGPQNPQMEVR